MSAKTCFPLVSHQSEKGSAMILSHAMLILSKADPAFWNSSLLNTSSALFPTFSSPYTTLVLSSSPRSSRAIPHFSILGLVLSRYARNFSNPLIVPFCRPLPHFSIMPASKVSLIWLFNPVTVRFAVLVIMPSNSLIPLMICRIASSTGTRPSVTISCVSATVLPIPLAR